MTDSENTYEKSKKELKRQNKLNKINQKWLKKYGVTYNEVVGENATNLDKKSEKNKNKYGFFVHYFTKYKFLLLFSIIFCIIGIILRFCSIPLFQNAIDFCIAKQWNDAIIYVIFSGISFTLGFLSGYLMDYFITKISTNGVSQIRLDLARKVLNTTSESYKTLSTGEIVYRVSNEPNDFANALKSVLYSLETALFSISALIYILISNYLLGICFVAIVLFNLIRYYFVKRKRKILIKRNKVLAEKMNANINEFVRGSDDVKSLNLKHSLFDVFNKWTIFRRNAISSHMNYDIYLNAFSNTVTTLITFSAIILGIYLTSIEVISFGLLVVFLNERGAPSNFAQSLVNALYGLQDSKVSTERMCKLFDDDIYKQEKFGDKEVSDFKGKIEFKNVSFSYDEERVLDNISFLVPPNSSLGIVGKSGEGKSTILSLIERLIDAKDGEILIDGINNKELTENSLRKILV